MMEKIFETSKSLAEYLPDKKSVVFTLVGYADVEEHKKMYLKVLDFMQSHKVLAFMHNLTDMKGTFTQMNDWLVETFRPAVELGLKYEALVLSNDVFTAFAANDIAGKVKLIQLQIFKTIGDAEAWLDEKLKESSDASAEMQP